MYTHLLAQVKQLHPEWKESTVKNTLLLVALILSEKTVSLWKLKGAVGRQLGNTAVDSRSHYQRLKRWLWQEKAPRCLDSNCESFLGSIERLHRLFNYRRQ
ncbi:MAG: hypothetical protein V4714_15100 [Bacteroidota bacterium]